MVDKPILRINKECHAFKRILELTGQVQRVLAAGDKELAAEIAHRSALAKLEESQSELRRLEDMHRVCEVIHRWLPIH
jgi:hypothetical protein